MTQSHFLLSVLFSCVCHIVLYGVCVSCCGGIVSSVYGHYYVVCDQGVLSAVTTVLSTVTAVLFVVTGVGVLSWFVFVVCLIA